MAVKQTADGNSKKPVEEPVQHCGGEGTDAGRCGLVQQRKSDCPSTRPKGIRKDDCGVRIKDKISDRLSDIDDIEIVGYLRTKEEIHLKRILWEATNEKYIKAKKQKQAAGKKKGVSVKKTTKTTEKVEPERRSSRINYDALKSLDDDLGSCGSAQTPGADSYAHGTQNSPHGNISPRMHGSNENWEEEEEDEHNETFETHEVETHYQYGGEDFCDDGDFDS